MKFELNEIQDKMKFEKYKVQVKMLLRNLISLMVGIKIYFYISYK